MAAQGLTRSSSFCTRRADRRRVACASALAWTAFAFPAVGAAQRAEHLRSDGADRRETAIRIDLRASPCVDLYFHVRTLAGSEAGADASDGRGALDAAVAAARALGAELGSPLAWGPVEGLLGGCESARQALAKFRELPETITLQSGNPSARLREHAVALGEALVAAEPQFRATTWPGHERAIAAARARIDADLAPREAACYARVAGDLGFDGVELSVPVYLVAGAPPPGAVTQRDDAGRGVCFVAVAEASGSLLYETIVHETIHALDMAANEDALDDLRARLKVAGSSPRDREYRDLPHTLMFVEAAHVVRAEIDRDHVDYGDAEGYYARVPGARAVREAWTEHLAGRATREEALARIVEGVVRAHEAR